MNHRSVTRILPVLAASSLLAACQGGSTSAPPFPAPHGPSNSSAQSAARAAQSAEAVTATPASIEFTADQAVEETPQSVTISAGDDGVRRVSIAGTGNCPAVSPAKLKPQKAHGGDPATGVITVTPVANGPANCLITVNKGDGDDDGDGAQAITIPVTIDAAPTPPPNIR